MDTTKLEAGPELDALVAERVMGWKWTQDLARCCNFLIPPHEQAKRLPEYLVKNPEWEDIHSGFIPTYSTDISAAYRAMNKVTGERADEFALALLTELNIHWRDRTPVEAVSDVMSRLTPLAICRAALAAVEDE